MTSEQAGALTKRILSFAQVPEVEVSGQFARRGHLRFARNAASTSGETESADVTVTAWKGRRKASVSASLSLSAGQADDGALRRLVGEAEALAALSPEDGEYLPLLGPQTYPEVNAWDRATAELAPAARAKAVGEAIAVAKSRKVVAAGFFQNSGVARALANSAGLFACFPASSVSFSITARTPEGTGSGFAAVRSMRVQAVDCQEAAAIACKKALDSRAPREMAPGAYPTILEPQAAADLFAGLLFSAQARAADEGRSVFSAPGGKTRIGEKTFDSRVTLYTDPQHPVAASAPLGEDGFPAAKAYLSRQGVLENLTYSRYWAQQKGRKPGPFFVNLVMDGEGKSLAQMIGSLERGILLTRLWYIRAVDPQQGLVTGLTRDGSFYIEKGQIRYPIKNLRFNESLVRILGEVEGLGTPQRVAGGEGSVPMLLPAIQVRSFRFTSVSDAI